MVSNTELVRRIRARDEAAWRTLVIRYEALVISTVHSTGLRGDLVDDAFQRVWMELYLSIERLRNPEGLPQWLIVTARRIALKLIRAERPGQVEVRDDLADSEKTADMAVEDMDQARKLWDVVAGLGEPCATLIRALFEDGEEKEYSSVARDLQIPVGSIGPTRGRCLAKLQRALIRAGMKL